MYIFRLLTQILGTVLTTESRTAHACILRCIHRATGAVVTVIAGSRIATRVVATAVRGRCYYGNKLQVKHTLNDSVHSTMTSIILTCMKNLVDV